MEIMEDKELQLIKLLVPLSVVTEKVHPASSFPILNKKIMKLHSRHFQFCIYLSRSKWL